MNAPLRIPVKSAPPPTATCYRVTRYGPGDSGTVRHGAAVISRAAARCQLDWILTALEASGWEALDRFPDHFTVERDGEQLSLAVEEVNL